MPILPGARTVTAVGQGLSPQFREKAQQLFEASIAAFAGVAFPAVIGMLTSPGDLDWTQIKWVLRIAIASALVPVASYYKSKARLPEAHLPELGSRGDRHTDPPPPPLPVVAIAKAAVAEATKGGSA